MTVYSDENGNIYLRKGDTGQVEFTGFPTDKAYTAYFSVFDEENNKILAELTQAVNNGVAVFPFTNTFTDSLKIGEFTYGLKICSGSGASAMEDTLLPRIYVENGELIQVPAPLFTVLDKVAEGVE